MFKSEELAKEIFEKFCKEETGKEAKWEYLGKKRQKAWIRDVLLIADRILIELRKDVKPIPPNNNKAATSYTLGYITGKQEQQILLIAIFQKYHDDLMQEYQDYLTEK